MLGYDDLQIGQMWSDFLGFSGLVDGIVEANGTGLTGRKKRNLIKIVTTSTKRVTEIL
jgi:hypothetical protein